MPADSSPTGRADHGESFDLSLHVPGILRLLGEHLYSEPTVALRELIQNAHDSCQRRRVEMLHDASFQPRIDIRIDAARHTLSVEDNGAGLTAEEIHAYVATIGRGYTAELRQRLEFGSHDDALTLIGQFGLGLLSAFLVARQVEMVTQSCAAGSSAWRWRSDSAGRYTLAPAYRPGPGTTLTLHLKAEGEFLLNDGLVRDIVRTYADFLPIPIAVNGSAGPVNSMDPPWYTGGTLDGYAQFVAERWGVAPLAVFPLSDHTEPVRLPDGTLDAVVTPLRGVLFIPAQPDLSYTGDLAVYVRRMLISPDERDLLPRWARFVRGVVDCPALSPTASREQIRRDEVFYALRSAIEHQLVQHVRQLADGEPGVWREIVRSANDEIKAGALESADLFEVVCDLVTFESTRGALTLPEACAANGSRLIFTGGDVQGALARTLAETQGLVAIAAGRFVDRPFLEAYARTHPDVTLEELRADNHLEPAPPDVRAAWQHIIRYYAEQGIPAQVAGFEPAGLAALYVVSADGEHLSGARSALGQGHIRGRLGDLLAGYLNRRQRGAGAHPGVLYLNMSNRLLQRLQALPPDSAGFTEALEIIYHTARLTGDSSLSAGEVRQSQDMISHSLEQLLLETGSRTAQEDSPPSADRE